MRLFYLVSLLILLSTCANENEFSVRAEVQQEVEKKLGPRVNNLYYQNEMIAELTLDGKVVRTKKVSNIMPFRTFHYYDKDTLKIVGGFGHASGFGFMVKIHNRHATVFHLVFSEESPRFMLQKKSRPEVRIEVPCKSSVLRISHLPRKKSDQTIYGFVSFSSATYFERTDNRIHSRSSDMDIYFVSRPSR